MHDSASYMWLLKNNYFYLKRAWTQAFIKVDENPACVFLMTFKNQMLHMKQWAAD